MLANIEMPVFFPFPFVPPSFFKLLSYIGDITPNRIVSPFVFPEKWNSQVVNSCSQHLLSRPPFLPLALAPFSGCGAS